MSGRSTADGVTRPAGVPLLGIDAFTDRAFAGNPAAVCLLDKPADEEWMQSLGTEMNLSETAFLFPESDGYNLRWFTPTVEVELCGHATLASAHALWETKRAEKDQPINFHTRWKGTLTATSVDDAITLDFPSAPSTHCEQPAGLADALDTELVHVEVNDLHHIAELKDAAAVRELSPDFRALAGLDVEALTVTARSDEPQYDFVSRYFVPKYGVDEDPVTGAAHTTLAPYWAERLGKSEMVGYQASKRGGVVRVRVRGERVDLVGRAVTVWRGELA